MCPMHYICMKIDSPKKPTRISNFQSSSTGMMCCTRMATQSSSGTGNWKLCCPLLARTLSSKRIRLRAAQVCFPSLFFFKCLQVIIYQCWHRRIRRGVCIRRLKAEGMEHLGNHKSEVQGEMRYNWGGPPTRQSGRNEGVHYRASSQVK